LEVKHSPRHLDIIRLIAWGGTNKSIGRDLGISAKTVMKHRIDIHKKYLVSNAADVTRLAMLMDIVTKEAILHDFKGRLAANGTPAR